MKRDISAKPKKASTASRSTTKTIAKSARLATASKSSSGAQSGDSTSKVRAKPSADRESKNERLAAKKAFTLRVFQMVYEKHHRKAS